MRIERLTLKGFLRFREQVTLDLRQLPPGLVAIVGPNGEGKTTLLEAPIAALYREFPSREKELSVYATDRDSFIDVEFAVDGRGIFRARVTADGLKHGSDAVLEHVQPNGARAVLNDGKVSTFDAAVAREFPPKSLLLASAFAAQNKAGSFVSIDKRERKQLFMTLLGIERYQTMSDTARQAASFIDQFLGRQRAAREVIARDTAEGIVGELDRLAHDLQTQGMRAETRQTELKAERAKVQTEIAAVQGQVAAFAFASDRLRGIDADLASKRDERARAWKERTFVVARFEDYKTRILAKRDSDLTDTQARIAGNEVILKQGTEIREAVARIGHIDAHVSAHVDTERDLATSLAEIDGEARTIAADRDLLARDLADLRRAEADVKTLADVPCGGVGQYAACLFLTNATASATRTPALQAEITQKTQDLTAREALRLQRRSVVGTQLTEVRALMQQLRDERGRLTGKAAYADKLAAAEARIAELTDKLAGIERDANAALVDAKANLDDRQRELASAIDLLSEKLATLDLERVRVEADVTANQHGHAQAIVLQDRMFATMAAWDETTATIARVASGREELERRRADLLRKLAELKDLDALIHRLSTDLLEWQLLSKALGRDGLPVLEIDAAGPTISAYTNELLAVCYESRFTVELVTQEAKASGKGMKEDFTVKVFDNQRGSEPRDIVDLSGGEQVIVSEALMNAIACFVNRTSPMPVRTCWRDETTGALDPENAARYLAMLRKVQELGGFHHVLFITHNPDAAALADAQIRVAGGAVSIAQPPYAAEAA